jgi:uncharacterized metal-binding protein
MVVFAGCLALAAYMLKTKVIRPVYLFFFLVAYLFSSLFLSPDLDLKQSIAFRRWGLAHILWLPYAHLFHHRALSHHILFGPLTRILYLGAILFVASMTIANLTGWQMELHVPNWAIILSILAGIYLPNQIHTLADALSSVRHHR